MNQQNKYTSFLRNFTRTSACTLFLCCLLQYAAQAQPKEKETASKRTIYGLASYYANKFEGRLTANGEVFSQSKLTAACNVFPLGTRLKVTNLRNRKSVIVRTNDRLHPNTRRIIDLTHTAASKLGFIHAGLARVRIEVVTDK
ncbi:MAG: septal ring lytic transglycosylase RlpA family protein [Ferruginibacter sp.]|nr:septal ring lytic transglycosylase RlpA family protein [Ferruginibacter sp.]